jgi:hypothetical protein
MRAPPTKWHTWVLERLLRLRQPTSLCFCRTRSVFCHDGYPDRQDLKLTLLHLALKEGTRISLGTDAHHPWQLAFMEFALAAAVLAGFRPPQIVNFLSVDELRKWVSQISQPHSSGVNL